MTYKLVIPVEAAGGFVDGVLVDAWRADRFADLNVPALDSNPPSGTADAGPVATAIVGAPGQAVLDVTPGYIYNIRVIQGTHAYWTQTSEALGVKTFQGRSAADAVLTKDDVTGTGVSYADVGADPGGAAAAVLASVTPAINAKVSKAGDTMTGDLLMGGHKVSGLPAGAANGDAVRFEQLTPANTGVTQFKILSCVLSAASGTIATTSLSVNPTPQPMKAGSTLQLLNYTAGGGAITTQLVMLSTDHAIGATTLTVNSFVPSLNFPIGTEVYPQAIICDLAALGLSKATLLQFEMVSGGCGGGGGGTTSAAGTAQGAGGGGGGGTWLSGIIPVGSATQITGIRLGLGTYGGTGGAAGGFAGGNGQAGFSTTLTLNGTTLTTSGSGAGIASVANSTTGGNGGMAYGNKNGATSWQVPGGGGVGASSNFGSAGAGFAGSGGGGGGVSTTTNGGAGGGAGTNVGGTSGSVGGGSTSPANGLAGASAAINSGGGGGGGGAGGGQVGQNGAGGAGGAGGSGFILIKVVG